VDRLGALADDTGEFHDRMERLAGEIAKADDIGKLSGFVGEVMKETRGIQTNVEHSREELAAAREQALRHQARVRELEGEIAQLSDRLHEDALTQVLNRRGLDRSFDVEAARADRRGEPLCLAILDVDNFKQVNDKFGHHAGDLALVHLASVIRQVIRPFDVISRYGGEEFVLLLPHTDLAQATLILTRVQRELTKRFFLHNNERVLITFSAGVGAREPNEQEDALLERADKALYRAKQSGKNRVETA
jgi:diguanylate cyclase